MVASRSLFIRGLLLMVVGLLVAQVVRKSHRTSLTLILPHSNIENATHTNTTTPKNESNTIAENKFVSCSWNHNNLTEDCYSILQPLIQGTRRWYFMGDSTMARPFQSILRNKYFRIVLYGGLKKNKYSYYRYKKNESLWVPPNHTLGEGPRSPPVRFRTSCTTCINMLAQHKNISDLKIEFLAVEYSLDVTFPTETTRTSQETAVKYILENRGDTIQNESACVVGGGFHDMLIQPPMSANLFASRARYWQRLLKKNVCRNVIWININAARDIPNAAGKPYYWSRERIIQFNQAVHQMMELEGGGILLDIFPHSTRVPFADLNHMTAEFYHHMGDFLYKLMMDSVPPTKGEGLSPQ